MPALMQPIATDHANSGRAALLTRVFALLERENIPWCMPHGSSGGLKKIPADVDLIVDGRFVPGRLADLLVQNRDTLDAQVVLWLEDGAQYIVLASAAACEPPCIVQLHISTDYVLADRRLYTGTRILESGRSNGQIWTASPAIEFGCILVNRVTKQSFRTEHLRRLAELYLEDAAGCERETARFFGSSSVHEIMESARTDNWDLVRRNLPMLRAELFRSMSATGIRDLPGRWMRRLRRWASPPCGLHLVFLGPDGVGKSTVIEAVRRDLAPIFLHDKYLTFAPGLLPARFEVPKPDGPHSLPPRSFAASLIKAAWWSVCYTAGYYLTIHPTVARAGMVVNHRYLPDAIVDPKRYRYSGPQWILRALWRIAPKPHLLFLLDAPAEVIQARKKEVAPEETRRQREAYRQVVGGLPFARVIDANRPVNDVVADIEQIVLRFLSERTARQRGTEARQ